MKPARFVLPLAALAVLFSACETKKTSAETAPKKETAAQPDTPILPAKKGDTWRYDVTLEIPANTTGADAPEVKESSTRTRTYLGKVSPAPDRPEVDCFEVITADGSSAEREFVEIYNDRVLMRGSMTMLPKATKPIWLDRAIPFVISGMKAGTEMPELEIASGGVTRKTRVVAREDLSVPAGLFPCIRILMTGKDGDIELRRTTWFSPGTGIVREEKTRYRQDKLIYREVQQLMETSIKRP